MSAQPLIKAFEKELNLTEKGLAELAESKKGLVFDVSTNDGFKAARKEKTEQNGLLKDIDRLAIDSKSSIDDARKELKSKVEKIYLPTVNAFDNEDAKRKEAKKIQEAAEESRIAEIKKHIASIEDNAKNLHGKSSEEISAIIEAVDLIDVSEFFAEFTTDAMAVIKVTLTELNLALSYAIQNAQLQAEQDKLKIEREQIEKDKAEIAAFKKAKHEKEQIKIKSDDVTTSDIPLSSTIPAQDHDVSEDISAENMATITESEYNQLRADSRFLSELHSAGVEGWGGYVDAMSRASKAMLS